MANEESRLDRVERILAEMAERQDTIQKIVESNARSNQANSEAIAEVRRSEAELRANLQEFIRIVAGYAEATNRRLGALEDDS